jgi:hypothetical protein
MANYQNHKPFVSRVHWFIFGGGNWSIHQGFSLGHFLGHWPKDFENDLNFEDF